MHKKRVGWIQDGRLASILNAKIMLFDILSRFLFLNKHLV